MPAPRRPLLVWLVRIMGGGATLSAALLLAGTITLIFTGSGISIAEYVVLVYVAIFALGAIVVEMGITETVRDALVSKSFMLRGLFYSFIGTLILAADNDMKNVWKDFVKATGWIFVITGIVYFGMGALCIDKMYQKHQASYNDASAKAAPAARAPASEA